MSESFSTFREQYLSRHENPVNGALHTVADVVEMISRKLLACTISEAARGLHQGQASTAEAPRLDSNVNRTCFAIGLQLLLLPLSRNWSRPWENETVDHRARSKDRRGGGAMSVSEKFRGVVDEPDRMARFLGAVPMSEVTRDELAAMTDRELLAYEHEHHGDPYSPTA